MIPGLAGARRDPRRPALSPPRPNAGGRDSLLPRGISRNFPFIVLFLMHMKVYHIFFGL